MSENIEIVLADKKLLLKFRNAIQDMMEYSYSVNFSDSQSNNIREERYKKLLAYYESGSAKIIVAILDDCCVGYAWFFQILPDRLHLNEIAVGEKFQSKGIGKKLILFIEKYAIEQSISQMELYCMEKNEKAGRFYSKMGYKTEKLLLVKSFNNYDI